MRDYLPSAVRLFGNNTLINMGSNNSKKVQVAKFALFLCHLFY